MADSTKTPSVTQTDQSRPATADTSSDAALERRLAHVPGLEKYFGTADVGTQEPPSKSAKTPKAAVIATPEAEEPELEEEGDESDQSSDETVGPEIAEEDAAEGETPSESEGEGAEVKAKRPELSPTIQKRFDKLTARAKAAEEKAQNLEAKYQEMEARAAKRDMPPENNPLANVDTPQELEKRFAEARKVKKWALQNLEGGQVEASGGGTEYLEGSQVRNLLALSEELLTEHIPARRQYLKDKQVFDAQAKAAYPALFKQGTEENQLLNAWLSAAPEVTRFADYRLIIGDALAGQKLRLSKTAKAKTPAQTNGQGATMKGQTLAAPQPASGAKVPRSDTVVSPDLLKRVAGNDRQALDSFSESLILQSRKKGSPG